jgi:hypothetical protein
MKKQKRATLEELHMGVTLAYVLKGQEAPIGKARLDKTARQHRRLHPFPEFVVVSGASN